MLYFPICLDLSGKTCIVIGGGQVAERKILSLLECGARITVVSPELTDEVAELATTGRINLLRRLYRDGDLQGSFLTIAATDDPTVQQAVQEEAERHNLLLNVADVPDRCNFILPATMRRGDLAICVSTGGKSPALARQIKKELEDRFDPAYAIYNDLLGAARPFVLQQSHNHQENKKIFNRLLHREMINWIQLGQWDKIKNHFAKILGQKTAEECLKEVLKPENTSAAATKKLLES